MRKILTLAAMAAFTSIASAGQPPAPMPEALLPMPKVEPKAKVQPDRPHKILVGEWEMVQFLRPFPGDLPIRKGTMALRDDLTFTWTMADGDSFYGRYAIYNQKLVLTRKTQLGETFTYNFTHLDIVNGKITRPIGANCYEEWSRIPPKKN